MSSEPRLEISSSRFSLPPNFRRRPSLVAHQTSCPHSHFLPLVHTERTAEVDRSGLPPLICGGVRGCRYVARGEEKGLPSLLKRISPRNRWMLSQAVDRESREGIILRQNRNIRFSPIHRPSPVLASDRTSDRSKG